MRIMSHRITFFERKARGGCHGPHQTQFNLELSVEELETLPLLHVALIGVFRDGVEMKPNTQF
jgi:hypothetical protein